MSNVSVNPWSHAPSPDSDRRGHTNGNTYVLLRLLPDGTVTGGIPLGNMALTILEVKAAEWREATVQEQ